MTADLSTKARPLGSNSASGLEAAYDRQAAEYDAMRYERGEGPFFDQLEGQLLCEALSPRAGIHILDLPTGTGRSALALARAGAHVTAVDISAKMLCQAERKARRESLSSIKFLKASAFELPFEDNRFDAVSSFKFFHLLDEADKQKALSEMRRVLKPGGRLVAEFNSPFYGGVFAFYRYYFRKKRPGQMRKKCLFPGQVGPYFDGMNIVGRIGVKLPFAGAISRVSGQRAMLWLNRGIGRVPVLRQFCYCLLIVAEKPQEVISQ